MMNYVMLAESSFDISSYISYLPLAHIYERSNQVTTAYYGVAVGFYQGVRNSSFLFPIDLCVCWSLC